MAGVLFDDDFSPVFADADFPAMLTEAPLLVTATIKSPKARISLSNCQNVFSLTDKV